MVADWLASNPTCILCDSITVLRCTVVVHLGRSFERWPWWWWCHEIWQTVPHVWHDLRADDNMSGKAWSPVVDRPIDGTTSLICWIDKGPSFLSFTFLFVDSVLSYVSLLYLISKSVHVIGRNRITWRSLNLASALTRHFLPSLVMHVSFHNPKQQLEPLDWHI